MSGITQNLLSTYYGFGKEVDAAKTLSVHEWVHVSSDDTNSSLVDESLENEENTLTKESTKEEDTIEQYEDGFSTLDEKSTIEDEEVFEDDDLLNEYVGVLESLREQKDYENFKTDAHFEKLNSTKNVDTENSIKTNSTFEKVNEDQKHDKHSSFCAEFSPKKRPSCNGIFCDQSRSGISILTDDMFIHFPNLKMLYLEGNSLKELPGAIFKNLEHLQWLDVRNNQLNCLPSDVKYHPNLETILIQRNKMERLPLEVGTLPKLKTLSTAHNPLIYPSMEILSLGSTDILRYLRNEWIKIHPEELIKLSKVSEEITPKPSTILCHQPKTNITKKLKVTQKESISKAREEKSVKKKIWNYKPSNRYNMSSLQNSNNKNGGLILCEECAASLLYLKNKVKNSIFHKSTHIKKYTSSRLLDDNIKNANIPTGMHNIRNNILILMGPSPRSHYVRNSVNNLISCKQNLKRLCELNSMKINLIDRENGKERYYTKLLNKESEKVGKREFDIIMNNATTKKLSPLELKKPQLMLEFLENYLGMKK